MADKATEALRAQRNVERGVRTLGREGFGLICHVKGCARKAIYAIGQDGTVVCATHLIEPGEYERPNADES